jgi:glycosyltransferase involved in cell wall biosynthesis
MTKPLRIGLIMQGGRGWLGGTEYIKNIIFALASLPPDVRSTFEVYLICSQSLDAERYSEIHPYVNNISYSGVNLDPYTLQEIPVGSLNLQNRILEKLNKSIIKIHNPRFKAFLKEQQIDFVYPYFNPGNSQISYNSAAWIYDFQHRHLPQFFTEQESAKRDNSFSLMARYASSVVLSSKTAEADFLKLFPEAAQKSKVLSFRTSPSSNWYEVKPLDTQKSYSLPDRFFLISNQFWQHKNHLVVFEALRLLQKKSIYPNIVCTGHIYDYRRPDYADTIMQTIHKLGIAHQVYLLGLIPRLAQIQLMRRSLAVIQPSLFEGWSTVVEDARCLGKPIILSDIPVHLEQHPPNSLLFERNSPESLATLLTEWWEHLSPGPDPEQEAIARTNNRTEVQAFGYRFLEIAKSR